MRPLLILLASICVATAGENASRFPPDSEVAATLMAPDGKLSALLLAESRWLTTVWLEEARTARVLGLPGLDFDAHIRRLESFHAERPLPRRVDIALLAWERSGDTLITLSETESWHFPVKLGPRALFYLSSWRCHPDPLRAEIREQAIPLFGPEYSASCRDQ